MEPLYFNLDDNSSKGRARTILLWVFASSFYLIGTCVLFFGSTFGIDKPTLCIAPYGIAVVVTIIAIFDSIPRKDIFFLVNDDKIEYRYGFLNPKKQSLTWNVISRLVIPHKEKKLMFFLGADTTHVIDLTWIEKKRSSIIRKAICSNARDRNIDIITVNFLSELNQVL